MTIDRAAAAAAYDAVAETYEDRFLDELESKPRDRELLDEFARSCPGLVVDLGCGPGQIGAYVRGRGEEVIGVDLSHRMAVRAAGRLDGAVVADMRSLPVRDRALGGVVAFYSLIHLAREELVPAFAELARVLRTDGRILVAAHEGTGEVEVDEFLGHQVDLAASLFTLDELENSATVAGLATVRRERRDPYENEGTTVRLYLEVARR